MDQPPHDHPTPRATAAALVVADVLAVLPRDPVHPDAVPGWVRGLSDWPGRIVPDTDNQVHAAVLTLLRRTCWPRDQVRDLIHALGPLYRAGWCNDALIHALDHDPDGTRVQPWLAGPHDTPRAGQSLLGYLGSRIRRWCVADPDASSTSADPPAAPLPATAFTAWVTRMHTVYGGGHHDLHRDLRPRADQHDPQDTYDRNHRSRVDRVQARAARRATMLTELGELAGMLPAPDQGVLDPDLVLLADPDVHDALARLVAADQPGRRHLNVLRHAVLRARRARTATTLLTTGLVDHAHLAGLASLIVRPDGTSLSPDDLARLIRRATSGW